jgi:diguanylate cyclase (GGDEF)-like protein
VTGRRSRRGERTGVLRARLVASILVAALLPFLAAWWIANAYVAGQARANTDLRLAFTARSAAREASFVLERSRARALELARDPVVQRAALRRDRASLRRRLRTGEAVVLAPARGAPAMRVGRRREGVPSVAVEVETRGRRLATVAVSAPAGADLLASIRSGMLAAPGDSIALVQTGVLVAGPRGLRGGRIDSGGHVLVGSRAYRARTVALPGYRPPAGLVAVADRPYAGDDPTALRRRLALAALVSLISIGLYAAALSRPLLRGLSRVASVAEQAMIDPLTGVSNRRGFERALEIELARSLRRGHSLALVLVDLDDFKQVNDRYGHGVGDDVLVGLAERLRDEVRSADVVARMGGEEFAMLLPETDLAGALTVAERARASFEAAGLHLKGGDRLAVTASFGAADYPASADRAALLRDADTALYAAKRLGKNRVIASTRAVEAA